MLGFPALAIRRGHKKPFASRDHTSSIEFVVYRVATVGAPTVRRAEGVFAARIMMNGFTLQRQHLAGRLIMYVTLLLVGVMAVTTAIGVRSESVRILDQMRKDGVTLAESYALSIENAMVTDSGISRIVEKARASAGIRYLRIYGQQGRFLTRADLLSEERTPPMDVFSRFDVEPDDALLAKVVASHAPADELQRLPSGETIFRVMVPLYFFESMVGAVEVGMDLGTMRAAIRQATLQSVALTVAAIIVGSLGVLWLALKITRPLSVLTAAARRAASGDLSTRIDAHTGDEIEDLAAAFNVMVENLGTSMADLRTAYRELERHIATICELKEYTDSILAAIPTGVITVDASGNVTTVNRAACKMLEVESHTPPPSGPFRDALRNLPPLIDVVADSISNRKPYPSVEMSAEAPHRATFLVSTAIMADPGGAFAGVAVTLQDITLQKDLQAKATRQDRLTELGRLAAAIAHEVRNPIGSIRSCARYMQSRSEDQEISALLDIVVKESDRLNVLVQQLLDFAQPHSTMPKFTDIGRILSEIVSLVSLRAEAASIRVSLKVGDIPGCFVDEDRIRQAFLNVCINALEAMEGMGAAVPVRRTRGPTEAMEAGDRDGPWEGGSQDERTDERALDVSSSYDEGARSIRVAFADTGPGIDPDVLPHIFEPFYTTRKRGTGLGLAIVKQIVEEHGGTVSVASPYPPESGHGTMFVVSLPAPYGYLMPEGKDSTNRASHASPSSPLSSPLKQGGMMDACRDTRDR